MAKRFARGRLFPPYTPPVMRKRELVALGVLLLLVALAFADLLSTRRALYVRDVAREHVPERLVLRDAVRSGFPFWNPRYAGGQPLAASPAFEVFYPPHWLIFLPNFLFAFALEIVVHYLIAAAGMFLLLRSLRLRLEAVAFGAFTFALSGLMLSFTNLLPYLFALAWWPWLAFFARRFFESHRPSDFALASLVLGLILLIGEPTTIIESGALLAAYAIYHLRGPRAIGWTAAICAAALLVGAAQVVPVIDHARDSGRATPMSYNEVTKWSLDPARPLELLDVPVKTTDPSGLPWLFSWYAGMLTAALLVAGFVHCVRGWKFVAIVVIVSYALAIGRHGPIIPLLYRAGLTFLRYPEKWFMPAAFVLIVFAAIVADRFFDDAVLRRTTHIAAGTFVIVNAIAGGVRLALATSVALTLILFLRGRLLVALLALFVIVDLGAHITAIAPRIDSAFYTDPPPLARGIPPHARIYNDADWQLLRMPKPPHLEPGDWEPRLRAAMLPELQTLWGFDGVLESDIGRSHLHPSLDFLRLFQSARFHTRRDLVPMLLTLAGTTHVVTLRDPDSATAFARVVALPGNEKFTFAAALAATSRIAEPHPWPRGIAFVDRPFAPAPARIVRVDERASAIDLDVEATGDALLVLAVTRHKYWRATIDGNPAEILPANVAFQALRVGRGRHHVALRYRNPFVIVCAIVSLIAVLALASVAALRSKAPPPPSPR
jgi:hypothetical protein